jgi:hypothetical protein
MCEENWEIDGVGYLGDQFGEKARISGHFGLSRRLGVA